jgi:hypothetical protein
MRQNPHHAVRNARAQWHQGVFGSVLQISSSAESAVLRLQRARRCAPEDQADGAGCCLGCDGMRHAVLVMPHERPCPPSTVHRGTHDAVAT